jgi:hypothetical protein
MVPTIFSVSFLSILPLFSRTIQHLSIFHVYAVPALLLPDPHSLPPL